MIRLNYYTRVFFYRYDHRNQALFNRLDRFAFLYEFLIEGKIKLKNNF